MAAKKKVYVVTGPYVTLKVGTAQGARVLGFYQGAVVPDDVSEESIQHHLDNDLIALAEDAEAEFAEAAPEPDENLGNKPAGNNPPNKG
jgi:hypothetical protein